MEENQTPPPVVQSRYTTNREWKACACDARRNSADGAHRRTRTDKWRMVRTVVTGHHAGAGRLPSRTSTKTKMNDDESGGIGNEKREHLPSTRSISDGGESRVSGGGSAPCNAHDASWKIGQPLVGRTEMPKWTRWWAVALNRSCVKRRSNDSENTSIRTRMMRQMVVFIRLAGMAVGAVLVLRWFSSRLLPTSSPLTATDRSSIVRDIAVIATPAKTDQKSSVCG